MFEAELPLRDECEEESTEDLGQEEGIGFLMFYDKVSLANFL